MPRYRFGDVEFDLLGFRLTRAGTAVSVEPKALEVLAFLLENRGRLVDKRELLAAVWRGSVVTENALTRVIAQLRKAIGDEARDSRFLETVPTRGYRFLADVEVEPDGDGAPVTLKPASVAPAPVPRSRHAWVSGGLVALLLAVTAGWWLGRRPEALPSPSSRPLRRALVSSTAGFNGFPGFSPDAASLAFVSDRSGRLEIYVKALAPGGQEVPVTADGQGNVQPAWSPDGRLLAYHPMARGGIWLVPALGGAPRRLTEFGSGPAWSPDGTQVAFQSLTLADLPTYGQVPTTLWIASVAGGAPRVLTRSGNPAGGHGTPSWSPDGRRLVFTADKVWTIGADGSDLRAVSGTSNAVAAIYGPRGHSVLWATTVEGESRLFRTRLDANGNATGAAEELAGGADDILRHLALSRDGRRLAFARADLWSGIVTVPLTGAGEPSGEPSPLTQPSVGRKGGPVFSRDGRRLAYLAFRPGAGAELWVRDVATGAERQVLFESTGGARFMPDWFPDGERLLVTVLEDGKSRFLSVGVAGETKRVLDLDRSVDRARLTPDGRAVFFQSLEDGVLNVWKATLATGAVKQVTKDREGVGWPVPSPDGRWLGLELFRGSDTTTIAVMPLEGGPVRSLVTTPGQNWLHSWSPDSRRLAFAARRDGVWNVYSVGLDGREQQLTRYTDVRSYVRYPAWSPRGVGIAYERTTTNSDVWVMDLEP